MTPSRYKLSEITSARVYAAIKRRFDEIPHSISWKIDPQSEINKQHLSKFHNVHCGQRCFIMGNGPSLARMDLSPLKNEITFGLNRIYLLFNKIPFIPTYYVCINELVLEQFATEIENLEMPKFINWNRRSLFNMFDQHTYFVKLSLGFKDYFGKTPMKPLSGGATVTYVALQIAYYMGFNQVILIGVDHNFAEKGTPNITEVRRTEQDISHFDPAYFPKGTRWQLPDLQRSELSYNLARQAYLKDCRQIYDATVDGKCQVFKKITYESLFT